MDQSPAKQRSEMMEALKPCPTCGALPCDQVNAPSQDPRPAAQPGVVKALEWNPYRALNPFGQYSVTDGPMQHGKFGCWFNGAVVGLDFGSVEEAKAAAQADYERRILCALAAPVSQEPVAWLTEWRFHKSGSDVKHAGGGSSITRDPNDAAAKFKFYQDWDHVESVTQTPLFASPQPLTEGEPTEAEVERIASWIAADTFQHLAPWSVDGAVADVLHGAIQTAARSALLAAKSKGGQADG